MFVLTQVCISMSTANNTHRIMVRILASDVCCRQLLALLHDVDVCHILTVCNIS